jgi:uncharacterized damage-inducible protein DinB
MKKTTGTTTSPEISAMLALLDDAYNKQAWHGPNLRGSLRRVTAAQAVWRAAAGRKNIWEIAVHAAYWKYVVLSRLTGQKRGSFPLEGSNWFPRDVADDDVWKADLKLLDRIHADLRSAVASLQPKRLETRPGRSKHTYRWLIQGVALHDVYHTGQIQTLRRLSAEGQ